jgi:hypothetical protein
MSCLLASFAFESATVGRRDIIKMANIKKWLNSSMIFKPKLRK